MCFIRDVAGEGVPGDFLRGRQCGGRVSVGDHDGARAFDRHPLTESAADSPAATGHDNDSIRYVHALSAPSEISVARGPARVLTQPEIAANIEHRPDSRVPAMGGAGRMPTASAAAGRVSGRGS